MKVIKTIFCCGKIALILSTIRKAPQRISHSQCITVNGKNPNYFLSPEQLFENYFPYF